MNRRPTSSPSETATHRPASVWALNKYPEQFEKLKGDLSLIPGVGAFNGSLSEGISDYLGATITGDSGLARGFFLDDEPLRHIDPEDREYVWPEDIGEIHDTGRIIAGALWDLRKRLIARYGEAEGVARADRLFLAVVRRAANRNNFV